MTFKISYALALLGQGLSVIAQTTSQFNQVINVSGDMTLNRIQFPDGSKIETYSQTQRQLLVNQNQAPLPGNQVTGTTGNPFVSLSTSSLIIQTNGATDLVGGQIELPINTQTIQQMGITADNTFVAKLSQDRQSWMVMDTIKTVNGTDNTVRIVKMTSIDGEYIALGRQTVVTGEALTQFGSASINTFNITGSGIQENEFTDGLRMSVRASQPMTVNMNVANGISTTMLSALGPGTQSVNNFRYLVTTNLGGVIPNINRMAAVMQLPINPVRLQTVATGLGATAQSNVVLSIAQRSILINPGGAQGISSTGSLKRANSNNTNSGSPSSSSSSSSSSSASSSSQTNTGSTNTGSSTTGQTNGNTGTGTISNNPAATQLLLSPTFTPIQANAVLDTMNARLAIPITQVDGEFILTVSMATGGTAQGTTPQGTAPQGTTPQGTTPQGTAPQAGAGTTPGLAPAPAQAGTGAGAPASAPSAAEPAGAAPAAAQPAAAQPAAVQPAGVASSPAAAEPAVAPAGITAPAPAAPAAPAAQPTSQSAAVSSGASGFVFKRQLPALPASQADGSVLVSMEWINYMAAIQTQGGAVNVGAMIDSLGGASSAAPASAALDSTSGTTGVTGLVGALKARHFTA